MSGLKAIECNAMVDAIERLIELKVDERTNTRMGIITHMSVLDDIEIKKRTIIDGLRFHSASRGVVGGGE